jgi:arylsulfatase A-like enzyme
MHGGCLLEFKIEYINNLLLAFIMKKQLLTQIFLCLNLLAFGQNKPNIILILADDLRADALGCYGNTYVRTPNIDSLARNGVTFTNSYILGGDQGAICSPSRAMLMTGKSYFRISNKVKNELTLPKILKNNGYFTCMTGKWHNEKEGVVEGFSAAKNIMFGGMADHFKTPMQDLKPDGTFTPIVQKGFSTDIFTETAVEFLDKQTAKQPFFLYVPFTAPHDPRSPSPKYQTTYAAQNMPLHPNFMPLHPFSFGYEMGGRDEFLSAFPRTTDDIKAQIADYYGMITHLDDAVGQILAKLRAKGLYKNTVVIFAADNGLGMGSHGLFGKQNMYEHSMRIPMIFAGRGIPKNKEVTGMAYLLDVLPTICAHLKLKTPENIDGQPLNALIKGTTPKGRAAIMTGYIGHQRAVRNDRYKLIRFPTIDHQLLFDLKNDPYELANLAEKADYQPIVKELTALLIAQQKIMGDTLSLTAATIKPKTWDYRLLKRVPDQWQPPYTLEKYFKN